MVGFSFAAWIRRFPGIDPPSPFCSPPNPSHSTASAPSNHPPDAVEVSPLLAAAAVVVVVGVYGSRRLELGCEEWGPELRAPLDRKGEAVGPALGTCLRAASRRSCYVWTRPRSASSRASPACSEGRRRRISCGRQSFRGIIGICCVDRWAKRVPVGSSLARRRSSRCFVVGMPSTGNTRYGSIISVRFLIL